MTTPSLSPTLARTKFEELITDIRPELHRYATRMIGSVVDGEDDDWRLDLGAVEHRPAILVYDPCERSSQPVYFMLLSWDDAQVSHIRDYRYARYVMRDAAVARV
jgi:hypothetical protein